MPRLIKVRADDLQYANGSMKFDVKDFDGGDVHVFFTADVPVKLYADINGSVIPLAVDNFVDQIYNFTSRLERLRFEAPSKSNIAYRLLFVGRRTKEVVDPVPYEAVVPLDQSPTAAMYRMLDQMLEQRGMPGVPRGRVYAGAEDQLGDDDDEYGPGYAYDEDVDRSAAVAVTKRLQSAGNDDKDKSARGKLEPGAADADPGEKSSGDDDERGTPA